MGDASEPVIVFSDIDGKRRSCPGLSYLRIFKAHHPSNLMGFALNIRRLVNK